MKINLKENLKIKNILNLLKKSIDEKDYATQAHNFFELGRFYYQLALNLLRNKEVTNASHEEHLLHRYLAHAVTLCTYVISISTDDDKNKKFLEKSSNYQEVAINRIKQIEQTYLEYIELDKSNVSKWKLDELHRELLKNLRDQTKFKLEQQAVLEKTALIQLSENASRLKKIRCVETYLSEYQLTTRQIYQFVNKNLQAFIKDLIEECKEVLGYPPCEYAVICFGSLARDEATPYSDLEFGILIDIEEEKKYFRHLTYLLYLKILNLGETTPRMQHIEELGEIGLLQRNAKISVKKGFTFDGQNKEGRKTPFGNKYFDDVPIEQQYELIHIPVEMAKLCNEAHYKKDKRLSSVLSVTKLLDGQQSLVDLYLEEVNKILNSEPDNIIELEKMNKRRLNKETVFNLTKETVAQQRSYQWLEESSDKFYPKIATFNSQGHSFSLKYDLYRLPSIMVDHLSIWFNITGNNTWDRIDKLLNKEVINKIGAENLKFAFSQISLLKLKHYLKNDQQKDAIFISQGITKEELFEIYYTILPFYAAVMQFYFSHGDDTTLKKSDFYHDNDVCKADIYMHLSDYHSAGKYLNDNAIKELPSIEKAIYYNNKGMLFFNTGDYKQAIDAFEMAKKDLSSSFDIYVGTILYNNLAIACLKSGNMEKAKQVISWLEGFGKTYGNKKAQIMTLTAIGSFYHEQGEYKKAIKKFEESNALIKEDNPELRTLDSETNFSCIGFAYRKLEGALENSTKNINADVKKAKHYLKQSLFYYEKTHEIRSDLLGEEHEGTLCNQNNMATVYAHLGILNQSNEYFSKAFELYKTTLERAKKNFGETHPIVAQSLNGIGWTYVHQKQYEKAKPYFEEAIKIMQNGTHDFEIVEKGLKRCELGENFKSTKKFLN